MTGIPKDTIAEVCNEHVDLFGVFPELD